MEQQHVSPSANQPEHTEVDANNESQVDPERSGDTEGAAESAPRSLAHDSMEEADRANGEGDPDDTPPVDAGGKRVTDDPV